MRSFFNFIPNIFGRQKYARRRIKPKLAASWLLVTGHWLLVKERAVTYETTRDQTQATSN